MSKEQNADTRVSLPLIFLLSFIALMSILMLLYSVFIREDEVLQQAGTAIDQPISTENEETYGYEITAQDIANEAKQIAPETQTEEEVNEEYKPEDTTTPKEPAAKKQDTPSDEPILQM